jgi:hypothetical protein
MKPHRLAVYGLAAGLLGGCAAGLVLTGTTLAGAQVTDVTGTVTDPAATTDSTAAESGDTTTKADCGRGHGSGHGFRNLDAAAQALGMTVEELRTALRGGKSLAAVAREKGIDPGKLVDALVAQMKARLDEHVASGKNTQAEADQMLADAKTRIEAFVNGTAPAPGLGFGGRHGGRGHGPRGSGTTTS